MKVSPLRKALQQWLILLLILIAFWSGKTSAHSSSNSYLTLYALNDQLTLRVDIHLRDIDLIFDLDTNRDGQVTWGEVQMRSSELSNWLDQGLQISASGINCSLSKVDLQVSQLADGTYLCAQWFPK